MTAPTTLFALAGYTPAPSPLAQSCLVLIDYQNEYLSGPLALVGAEAAVGRAGELLARARGAGTRIIHVAHKGAPGGLFDRDGERGAIIAALAPGEGEAVVEKPRPNAFSGTDLAGLVGPAATKLILAGFMTHMCLASTARAALDLGYVTTIAADACATRDLPGHDGGVIAAAQLHRAELAALGDRFACIADCAAIV